MLKLASKHLIFMFVLIFCTTIGEATYILRYSTTDNGGLLFTGNTLGLSKAAGQNQPGPKDSIGAFITTDLSQEVGNYPVGTTLNWPQNGSTAYLDLPEGSTVLYAELIWSGSYGFQNQITGNEPNTPVTLISPSGATLIVSPDPATSQVALTPGFTNAGNYTRSNAVTAFVDTGGAGLYTVEGIPATVSGKDDSHNAAGWTLAVIFQNGLMPTSNLSIFVGCEQASSGTNSPASVSGFCTPASGTLSGNLFVSAIEGDANIMGDRMLFGSTPTLTIPANSLSGGNNPINNFFGSQINTLLPFNGSSFVGSGQLDTRGSFGNFNANPFSGTILPGSRQGYDITSVDISAQLSYNQTVAYAKGVTTGDDYTLNALGMQIQVGAPLIEITKASNVTRAVLNDIVTFTFTFANTGTADAVNITFTDDLVSRGFTYVANSATISYDGFPPVPTTDPNPPSGIAVPDMAIGDFVTITFQAVVASYPPGSIGENVLRNQAELDYSFDSCTLPFTVSAVSNIVEIELPLLDTPALVASQLVNGAVSIGSSAGDVVTFTTTIVNQGSADALNAIFKNPLPPGLSLVSGSVLIDGEIVSPDPDLSLGFSIGNVLVGQPVTITFQALITDPAVSDLFVSQATIPYQYLLFAGNPVDADPAISNETFINLAVSPISFEGTLRRCQYLNEARYLLSAFWTQPFSTDFIGYRIYVGSSLEAELPPSATSTTLNLPSLGAAENTYLAAVYAGGVESERIKIRILP